MTAWIASSPETMESPVVGESSPSSSLQEESAAAIPGSSPSNTTSPTEVEIPEVPKLMEVVAFHVSNTMTPSTVPVVSTPTEAVVPQLGMYYYTNISREFHSSTLHLQVANLSWFNEVTELCGIFPESYGEGRTGASVSGYQSMWTHKTMDYTFVAVLCPEKVTDVVRKINKTKFPVRIS
ncbi:hypothetical protein Pelo_18736 [Pelomyxa schiedti]|nr:hypothetical protein Pelo_18736 [Pelomyxa schiedti]